MNKPEIIGHVLDGNDKYSISTEYLNKKYKQENDHEYENFTTWKKWLFTPWSPQSVWYEVIRQEDGNWLAVYNVIVYDTTEVNIQWISDTPTSAIQKVQHILLKLKNGVWG